MIATLLVAALCAQDLGQAVSDQVAAGTFTRALETSSLASASERAYLLTWTRHQAGDLTGAIEVARGGLAENPEDPLLLEQASYLCTSLLLGAEAEGYAETLVAMGHSSGAHLLTEARSVLAVESAVAEALVRVRWLIAGVVAVACVLIAYGVLGRSPRQAARSSRAQR